MEDVLVGEDGTREPPGKEAVGLSSAASALPAGEPDAVDTAEEAEEADKADEVGEVDEVGEAEEAEEADMADTLSWDPPCTPESGALETDPAVRRGLSGALYTPWTSTSLRSAGRGLGALLQARLPPPTVPASKDRSLSLPMGGGVAGL
ncbi:hypothetical protein BAU06_23790 [Bordetella bronchialis]|uniref:Uncharacterized protein n=1 Tax=Bordetella bronchialis TaxID=463025 RepID=A0ABN4RC49_9BORD|nr:hypothetical protein BAU06_23790 [Bordetella bronchialis]